MKDFFSNEEGALIILNMIDAIYINKQYLSDIDGLIGDGDHGINMNKGFQKCKQALDDFPGNLSYSASILSDILLLKVGGSMGPLYGEFFSGFSQSVSDKTKIDKFVIKDALESVLSSIQSVSEAKVGDKTLMDTLVPAVHSYAKAISENKSFSEALLTMKKAARTGCESTKNMIAKIGRASRLGERSKGHVDAGASSCFIILNSLADSCLLLINKND